MNPINHIQAKLRSRNYLWSNTALLIYLALAKLAIHLLTSTGYGYFGDELYWLTITKHLDFGYVDVPPLVAYIAALSRALFGASLFAVQIFPAIAGAFTVYCAGLVARELGGGRFAQWFTALAVLAAPYLLTIDSAFTYDPFDLLCTIILFYLVARVINQETPQRWLLIGIVAGLGVMTKLSMIFTAGALVLSLLLTSRRKSFLTVWPWLAAFIAALICMPFVIWQSVHGWPLFAYWHNYAMDTIRPHPQPAQFVSKLIFYLNPVLLPVLLLGLWYLLFHRTGKKYRILGFNFLILLVFFVIRKMEPRLLIYDCLPLAAAGSIWFEKISLASIMKYKSIAWLKWLYIGVVLLGSALLVPFSLPVLPIPVLEKYVSATPYWIKNNFYDFPTKFPIYLSLRFGWPEMVKEIAAVYHGLPENDREKCMIWTGMYWDAGAIDLFGKKYGLPNAMSNCLSYQIWGEAQLSSDKIPEVAIMLATAPDFPAFNYFEEVMPVKSFYASEYGMYANRYLSIYLCRKPKANFGEAWKQHQLYF